jgi:hypothetical protein
LSFGLFILIDEVLNYVTNNDEDLDEEEMDPMAPPGGDEVI